MSFRKENKIKQFGTNRNWESCHQQTLTKINSERQWPQVSVRKMIPERMASKESSKM